MKVFLVMVSMSSIPFVATADPSLECSSAGSQVEIGTCVDLAGRNVDTALNFALEVAQGSAAELDDMTGRKSAGPALVASQTAWTAYRDAHCEAVGASFGGGSGTGIAIASCRIVLGRARISELMRFAQ